MALPVPAVMKCSPGGKDAAEISASENVGIQVFNFAAAHGRDEVTECPFPSRARSTSLTMLDSGTGSLLAFGIELAAGEHAGFAVGDIAHLLADEGSCSTAHLEDELRVAVVHDRDLGVGRLAASSVLYWQQRSAMTLCATTSWRQLNIKHQVLFVRQLFFSGRAPFRLCKKNHSPNILQISTRPLPGTIRRPDQ